jgi:putative FmdB family regulatory protein
MPTYQYQCRQCGHEVEEFQSITEPPLARCPRCGTESLVRIIGGGAGLIFKGSGFYLTDYKKPGASAPSGKEGKGEKPAGGGTAEKK